MTLDRMALVIPAWNEARRLDDAAFVAFVASQELVDLHFVDDGSRDATPARLAALAAAAPGRITVQRLDPNRGKAEAVRAGLLAVLAEGYPLVGYLDADLAAPLDTALLLRDELVRWPSVSMVLGSRVKLLGWRIRRSERRHYLGRIFATCASITLALPVYDTQCGAKAMRGGPALVDALAAPFLSRWLFDVELIARLRDAMGEAALRELPLPRWEDPGGSSVGLRDFLRAPLELWRIWRRYPPTAGGG
ncbi:MAG: glycosyltransferase [Gemmatimonadales bacterium]